MIIYNHLLYQLTHARILSSLHTRHFLQAQNEILCLLLSRSYDNLPLQMFFEKLKKLYIMNNPVHQNVKHVFVTLSLSLIHVMSFTGVSGKNTSFAVDIS